MNIPSFSYPLAILTVLFLLPVLFPLQNSSAAVKESPVEKIIVISPHWEGMKIEVGRAFKEYFRRKYGKDITIEWLDQGGTSDDIKFVESMFQKNPSGIGVDVFFGGGMDPFLRLKDKKLLFSYRLPEEILKKIPAACQGMPNYDIDHYWYGIVLSSFGILYNKKVLDFIHAPVPETWTDLTKPVYHGWVGVSDPRHSGSIQMMFEIILQSYGWEKGWQTILGIAGNSRNFPSSAAQIAKDTSTGEVAVSMCIDSYALSQIDINGKENMGFLLPESRTLINPDAAGILKGAPDIDNAKIFLEFLLSDECQKLMMAEKGKPSGPKEYSLNRLSILPSIYKDKNISFSVNPYSLKTTLKFDFKRASERLSLINDLAGALAVDCAGPLRKCYRSVLEGKYPAEKFFLIPLSEKDADSLVLNWKDPVFRNRKINEFLKFFSEKIQETLNFHTQTFIFPRPVLLSQTFLFHWILLRQDMHRRSGCRHLWVFLIFPCLFTTLIKFLASSKSPPK